MRTHGHKTVDLIGKKRFVKKSSICKGKILDNRAFV